MTQSVDSLLAEVVEHWRTSGPLTEMLAIVDDVWRINLDRHEPGTLGDDAMSLGTQCARNIMNRCVGQFRGRTDGIIARGGLTLEVTFAGRVMHLSKVATQTRAWDPNSIDWDASGVRTDGARANAAAYTPSEGTLFEDAVDVSLPGPIGDTAHLTHLHLAWQGLTDAHTRAFVGFPTTGDLPWSAVTLVHDGGSGGGGLPVREPGAASKPTHDTLAEPALPMRRRTQPSEAGAARDSA